MLEVIEETANLLVVRERSWVTTRKMALLIVFPVALIPFFYGISYVQHLNWLALFFLINGGVQLFIFAAVMSMVVFIDTIWAFDKRTNSLTISKIRPSPIPLGSLGKVYLPLPEEYKLEDVADVRVIEKVDAGSRTGTGVASMDEKSKSIVYLLALEITGGSRIAMTPYHTSDPEGYDKEKRIAESIRSFLHLVRVDYSECRGGKL